MNPILSQFFRYCINGVAATIVHYTVLILNLRLLNFESAGLANFAAAMIGITVSFFGNKYFVFQRSEMRLSGQAVRFGALYGVIAIFHGIALFVWTDWLGLDFRVGFLVATGLQVLLSYIGNKLLVFSR